MLKRVRIKDGWEMFISIFSLVASVVILFFAYRLQEQALQTEEENKVLKYHISQMCGYMDTLPKKHRAVFEICLSEVRK